MKKYVYAAGRTKSISPLETEVRDLCASYNYKVSKFEEIKGFKYEGSSCVEMTCNNGSISIKAVGNYNYTSSSMQICPLWGRIIDHKRQIDGLMEAMELQQKIAELINAISI